MIPSLASVKRALRIGLATLPALLLAAPATAQDETDADDAVWDVTDPPGPRLEISIDTDEGTWMSVDVSPDGREVVFNLLGDLYVIPIEGGEARVLTSGFGWDMQPRYSPDGRFIAFTSDRAGGDNIWIMVRDGSDPKQLTEESFRLLNSPAWTPDSEFIAARKHFTATRSLGAGEIWLYHRTGGDGLQMTERPNEQKDVGEPAFSADGKYLYYSRDATPGETFQYDKDSNVGIYRIYRVDRETGEIE
ncbi:MAG: amidohydrolase, partial [Gemmatimonadota bacterium]